MQLISTLVFAGAASATGMWTGTRSSALLALRGIMERQVDVCVPVPAPATCERSCGPGNIVCISFPTCYNPSAGEVCCSDGNYCPAGYYCTDAGCCEEGTTLEECGASTTLEIVLPDATEEPTEETPSITSFPTTDAPTITGAPFPTTDAPSVTTHPSSGLPHGTATTSSVPFATAGVGKTAQFGLLPAIGGFGAFLMAL
jgi:hypothetical protein